MFFFKKSTKSATTQKKSHNDTKTLLAKGSSSISESNIANSNIAATRSLEQIIDVRNLVDAMAQLEQIKNEQDLIQIVNYAKNKYKKLYQVANAKLKELKQQDKQNQAHKEELRSILESLGKLKSRAVDEDFILVYQDIVNDWKNLEHAADADMQELFISYSVKFAHLIADYTQQQQEQEKQLRQEQRKQELLDSLSQLYKKISTPEHSEQSLESNANASESSQVDDLDNTRLTTKQLRQELEQFEQAWINITKTDISATPEQLPQVYLNLKDILQALDKLATYTLPSIEELEKISANSLEHEGVAQWYRLEEVLADVGSEVTVLSKINIDDAQISLASACAELLDKQQLVNKLEKKWRGQIAHKRKLLTTAIDRQDLLLAHNLLTQIEKIANKFSSQDIQTILSSLDKLQQEVKRLKDLQDFVLKPKQQLLCDQMRSLIGKKMPPKDLAAAIKSLQAQWQQLCKGTLSDDAVWEEFKQLSNQAYEPCIKFYGKLHASKEQHLQIATDLCNKLENFYTNTDWHKVDHKSVEKIYLTAIAEWKACKRNNFKQVSELQARFDAALEKIHANQDEYYQANATAKKKIIIQVKQLISDNPKDLLARIKQLQQRWRLLSPARHDVEQQLWAQLKEVLDPVFAARKEQQSKAQQEQQDIQDKLKSLMQQMQEMSNNAGADLQSVFQQLTKEVQELLIDLPEKSVNYWQKQIKYHTNAFNKTLTKNAQDSNQQDWLKFYDTFALTCKCEQAILAQDQQQTIELLSQINKARFIDNKLTDVIAKRVTALNRANEKALQTSQAQLDAARMLCVRAEMLAELEVPECDKQLSMQYKIENMVRNMQQHHQHDKESKQVKKLLLELLDMHLVATDTATSLNDRCLRLIKALSI